MNKVTLKFLGSGDAFGSGGRLQSCILIKANQNMTLLECGASSMIALRKHRVDCNDIKIILASNLHGDHFGGIPYFIWDAQHNRKRSNPLIIAGPRGINEKYPQLMEATFPGSEGMKTRFPLEIIELEEKNPWQHGEITVLPFPVIHADNDPHLALRIFLGEKILAYSGDTGWTENLASAA
ncbi:MAG: MBL fold metallo-hydrolase, partial [Syntrophomonas sp.]